MLAGFGVISSERESGRLKLLSIQGARPLPLLLAKTFALWTIGVALSLLVVGTHLLFAEEVDLSRTLPFLVLHLAVLWIVAAVVVALPLAALLLARGCPGTRGGPE